MKATTKNVTIDNHNAELVDFAKAIDFSELFEEIQKFTVTSVEFYAPEITTSRGEVHISFMSKTLLGQLGAFDAILENCCIESFNNNVFISKDSGKPVYWVTAAIRYKHKGGGMNGMNVCAARYTVEYGWNIETV